MNIELHTFPHGQQLSDGELVQVQVKQSGRLIFKDAYFHELQDGDVYIIPEQVELPMATDGEIIDFLLDNDIGFSSNIANTYGWIALWRRENYKDIAERQFDTEKTDLRSVFRELVSEAIANQEL
jgi:hypothetical protein